MCLGISLVAVAAFAQTVAPASSAASAPAAVREEPKPFWKDLTPAQQLALKPLETHWSKLSEPHKRKWVVLSVNFEKMSPTMQRVLQERMLDWGALSGAQRSQARLNFAEAKRLSPAEKQAKWEAYQTLGPEEKAKLAKQAPKKPAGAATATKLAPPQKLASVPLPRKNEPQGPSIAAARTQINPLTLLPLARTPMPKTPAVAPSSAKQ